MNNNALSFRVRPCIVCGFPFSDEHHIHPEILGRDKSPTVILCPNHHRLAHIVQGMVINNYPESSIFTFASQTLDAEFRNIGLPLLLNAYKELSEKLDKQSEVDLQKGDPVMVCIDCDRLSEEPIYRWGILKHKGFLDSVVCISAKKHDFQVKNQEIKAIVSYEEKVELVKIASRIDALTRLDLDPADYVVLDQLQRTIVPTKRGLLLLERMETDYGIAVDVHPPTP